MAGQKNRRNARLCNILRSKGLNNTNVTDAISYNLYNCKSLTASV